MTAVKPKPVFTVHRDDPQHFPDDPMVWFQECDQFCIWGFWTSPTEVVGKVYPAGEPNVPNEAVGAYFFHAAAEPSPSVYKPSSITVPLNLQGGHYGGFTGNTAVGLAVERTKGAGSGKCTLTNGYFETYEKLL